MSRLSADVTGLTDRFGDALGSVRQWRGRHNPGGIAVDLALMLADGGEAFADLAVSMCVPLARSDYYGVSAHVPYLRRTTRVSHRPDWTPGGGSDPGWFSCSP